MTTVGSGRVQVVDAGVEHLVNLLGARAAGQVRQAIVLLQAVDELTGHPVSTPVRVTSTNPAVSGGWANGGVAGLVGVPAQAMPALGSQPYSIDLTVTVDGFVPWTMTVDFATQAGFPETFTGTDLGAVELRRRPVALEITALRLDLSNRLQTLPGADIRIGQVWRHVADIGGAGVAAPMIGLPLGVSQTWPVGTALDSVSLLPAAEPVRRLARGTAPGEVVMEVDRLGALTVGDLIGLDLADIDRREYVALAAVIGSTDPDSPTAVESETPVRVAHATSATARRVPAPPGGPPDATLTEPAQAGDTTIFVDTVAPFAGVEILRASGGSITDEYVDAHLYRGISNAAGVVLMPGLSRVAAVELTATHGALAATVLFSPDYLSPTNSVALTLQ
ncbi:MAG: hypothetical protein QOG80_1647 [Pseudonocardiales bacterium]|jgi:hypothetical protein|nr:hypothetical protein [Pseudonocardiales bacterium]